MEGMVFLTASWGLNLNGEKVVASGASVVVVKGVGGLVGGNGDLWGIAGGALEGLL